MTSRARFRAQHAFAACAAGLFVAVAVDAQQPAPERAGPPTLFSAPLADVPGKRVIAGAENGGSRAVATSMGSTARLRLPA